MSRAGSTWGVAQDNLALEALAENCGLTVVHPESLTFENQVEVFSRAKFVVGLPGSAMNNLIFCAPTTTAVIIGGERFFNWRGFTNALKDIDVNVVWANCCHELELGSRRPTLVPDLAKVRTVVLEAAA